MIPTPIRRVLLAILVIALVPAGSAAFVREASNWDPRALPVPYRVNTSTAPASIGPSGAQSAVDSGFATWAGPSCTAWGAINRGPTTSRASASDRQNTVLWVSGTWPAALGDAASTIGITTTVWTTGGYFIDADIQFNNVRFSWSNTGTGGTVDTQSIATHEEGHFLGLGHSTRASAVMYPTYSGGLKRVLDSDDANGVCTIYPYVGPVRDAGVDVAMDVTDVTSAPDVVDTVAAPDIVDTLIATDAPPPALLGEDCSHQVCNAGLTCLCADPMRCVCSRTCSATNTCPTDYGCVTTSLGPYCIHGGGLGDPCVSGVDCTSGVCVNTGGTAICSRACTDDCTCPSSYTCVPTSAPGQSVCVPGSRVCGPGPDASTTDTGAFDAIEPLPDVPYYDGPVADVGENCSSLPCATGLTCLCGFTPYCVCAAECRSMPCAGSYTCQDTTVGPYCLPPGSGGLPCSSGADCVTGVCSTTAMGGRCAPSCRDDCDCAMNQSCYPSTNPGVNVCDVGFNLCGAMPDAGAAIDVSSMDATTVPDATAADTVSADGVVPGDAMLPVDGSMPDAADVVGTTDATGLNDALAANDVARLDGGSGTDGRGADGGPIVTPRTGCGCRVPGGNDTGRGAFPLIAIGLAAASFARRRRSRR